MDVVSTAEAAASSSSFDPPGLIYDVFRAESFGRHLYTALVNAGIHTFEDHRSGAGIDESESENAIQQSKTFLILFSEEYASSSWCLDALVKIMDLSRRFGRMVVPIFYGVSPSNVRHQTGSIGEALARFNSKIDHNHDDNQKQELIANKIETWRVALREAANLSGYDVTNFT